MKMNISLFQGYSTIPLYSLRKTTYNQDNPTSTSRIRDIHDNELSLLDKIQEFHLHDTMLILFAPEHRETFTSFNETRRSLDTIKHE
jgi:hypothetical protein